jgi:hypothetical protein
VSARSAQSRRLAAALSDRCGVRVELIYTGDRDRQGRHRDFWQVSWDNGPTPDTMRAQIAHMADRFPAVDIEQLRYSRGGSWQTKAAALLTWLPEHPERLDALDNSFVVDLAFDAIDHPERLDQPVQRRAQALLRLGEGWLSGAVIALFGRHCAAGWAHAERWLDGLVDVEDGRAGGAVIDLSAARTRRDHRQR